MLNEAAILAGGGSGAGVRGKKMSPLGRGLPIKKEHRLCRFATGTSASVHQGDNDLWNKNYALPAGKKDSVSNERCRNAGCKPARAETLGQRGKEWII